MPGSPSATLQGWAIPAAAAPFWDHTYVTSDCGFQWGCWGRAAGGRPLPSARGTGDSLIADCLSQPNSEAGIDYLNTGVCHQTANRILLPAGQVLVIGCNGYGTSTFLWGVYGKGTWPELHSCNAAGLMIKTTSASVGGGGSTGAGGSGTKLAPDQSALSIGDYHRPVSQASFSMPDEESIRLTELSQYVEATLGRPLDPRTFERLLAIQGELRAKQTRLSVLLKVRELSPDDYYLRLMEAIKSSMAECERLLGREIYDRLFGDAGRNPFGMADRDVFRKKQLEKQE